MQSKVKRVLYEMLSIVFVIFSIPFNLLEDFLPPVHTWLNNNTIIVNAEDSSQEQFIQAILDSEDIWQQSPNEYTIYFSDSDVYCWFEDLDMDGIAEFIVGPMTSGAHQEHDYQIWTYKNSTIEPFNISKIDYNGEEYSDNWISLWLHDVTEILNGKESFRWQLFKDKTTNEYIYVCIGADGVATEAYRYLDVLSCNDISIVDSKFCITTSSTSITCKVNDSFVTQDTFIEEYDEFFSNLIPYEITVSDFSYDSYTSSNNKKSILENSYNAWSYKENNSINLPLSDEVNELRNESYTSSSGKCGDNAYWQFDETTGTLTISGTGDMYDYDNIHFSTDEVSSPWRKVIGDISDITSIVIEDGITSIGETAFFDLSYVQSVKLPDTLESIGKDAFRSFSSENMFKIITIPSSVTFIGENALSYYDNYYNDENGDVYSELLKYDLTIQGYTGSQAETYAKENGITFIALDEDDFVEIPEQSQLEYTDYFIQNHLNDQRETNELWYETYISAPSNNELKKTMELLATDALCGSLYSVFSVQKMDDFLSLDLSQIDNNPFEKKTYYGQFLAQLVADSYNEKALTQGTAEYLIEVINKMIDENDEETVWNALKSSYDLNKLGDYFDGLDALQGLAELTNKIKATTLLTKINEFIEPISNSITVIGFAIDGKDLTVDYLNDIDSYIKYTACYRTFLNCTDEVKETFKLMLKNTNDEDLKNILNEYIGILDAKFKDSYIENLMIQYIAQEGTNTILDIYSKFISIILNDLIMDTPYLNVAFVAFKVVVSIEKSALEKFVDSQKLLVNITNILACNIIHQTLYRCYSDAYSTLENSPNILNAKILHTIFQYYKLTDILIIEYSKEYVLRFINNNVYMSVGNNKIPSPYLSSIMLIKIKDIFNTDSFQDAILSLYNLYDDLNELQREYISSKCCKSEEEWNDYIDAIKYYRSLVKDTSSVKIEEFSNWIETKKDKVIDFFSNTFNCIIVSCPVTVEVYNSENNLIALLCDDNYKIEYGYEKYFIIVNETTDEISNDSYNFNETKAKVIMLPYNNTEYSIKIIGTNAGDMDINCYTINSINDSNWFDTSNLAYNFEDIPLNQGDTFELNENTNGYILTNTATGETYTSSSLTDSTLHSNKILIVTIILAIMIIIIITGLIIKSKKRKNLQ